MSDIAHWAREEERLRSEIRKRTTDDRDIPNLLRQLELATAQRKAAERGYPNHAEDLIIKAGANEQARIRAADESRKRNERMTRENQEERRLQEELATSGLRGRDRRAEIGRRMEIWRKEDYHAHR